MDQTYFVDLIGKQIMNLDFTTVFNQTRVGGSTPFDQSPWNYLEHLAATHSRSHCENSARINVKVKFNTK